MGAIGMNCKRCDNEEDPFSALAARSKLPTVASEN